MVKDKTKKAVEETEIEFTVEKVEPLPPSRHREATGKYSKIVAGIAKLPEAGTYRIAFDKTKIPLKSVYPSIDVALRRLAKLNGVDFSEPEEVTIGEGKVLQHRYQKFLDWKKKNLRLRVDKGELYLEKVTDKALKIE